MKVRSKTKYPFRLRVFEDGRIKSRGLEVLPASGLEKYVGTLKTCVDCGGSLTECERYKYRCDNCGETFSWGFNTLQRDAGFYERHPEYK